MPFNEDLPRRSTFDLYPKSRQPLTEELFKDPPSEYRGCPLWAWNSRLHKPLLRKEIRALQEMGIGGFTMHARVGLDTPYLGSKFMDCVASCVAEAKKLNMKAFLYDEDRWPSGAAGGLITKDDPSLRMLHLLFTPWPYGTPGHGPDNSVSTGSAPFRGESGYLLGRYAISLNESGYMSYRHLQKEDSNRPSDVLQPGERLWYAYVEASPPSSWYNDAWYIDTMSPRAMKAFLDSTHEKYYNAKGVGSEFGKSLTAIFTDEPQFSGMVQLESADELKDCFAPWTEGLEKSFRYSTGLDLVAALPEIFWDVVPDPNLSGVADSISLVRYKYHDHISELFTSAFLDQLSEWCEKHSLGQMGHMMEEPTLLQQTQCLGEAMRTYRSMQIPGVDMLVDSREYNTVKQCSSVVRQYGRTACMSELYGVTNWTFSFKGYKGQGDWQAALGVTLRSHHLSWVSMNGEAKRDYPAQIGYQSPWYKEYGFIEDHFARVAATMSRGTALTRVAVVHPIESFWLRYGCKQTGPEQELQDQWFSDLTEWLLFDLIDFDFLSESLLPELVKNVEKKIKVGEAEYDTIILPQLLTIRSTTLSVLEDFARKGGRVIVAGRDPVYVDARPSTRFSSLKVDRINFGREAIQRAVSQNRDIIIEDKETGRGVTSFLYQWRVEQSSGYIFVVNTDRDTTYTTRVQLFFESKPELRVYETLSVPHQETSWLLDYVWTKSHRYSGWASFDWTFDGCASLLIQMNLEKSQRKPMVTTDKLLKDSILTTESRSQDRPDWKSSKLLHKPTKVRLTEPNCLLLDFCRYKVDDKKQWSDLDEILRIDNQVRDELKMPRRGDAMAQPWVTPRPRPAPKHTVFLQYHFTTGVDLKQCMLAIEGADITKVSLDGVHIPTGTSMLEYWVDACISKISLPLITEGKHEIILEIPFDELNTCMERIYLLGDFSVSIDESREKGDMAHIIEILDMNGLTSGDYTKQGLPFYTGNIEYVFDIDVTDRTALRIPALGVNPVVGVCIDGKSIGRIALPPYLLEIPKAAVNSKESHAVTVTVFGNRDHAFGAVHVPAGALDSYNPTAWRTTGDQWTDSYTIRPMGLLKGLELLKA